VEKRVQRPARTWRRHPHPLLDVLTDTEPPLLVTCQVLQLLMNDHPLPGMVLEYRMVARMVGGVIDPLRKKAVRCADGQWRVHCDWNHTRTATGRLSTCNPNMQAITK
jgi:DNA polymerase I-like protein with 3'-5' exonuclease and polymerase domains